MKMLKQMVNWFKFRYALSRINLKDGDILVFKDKHDGFFGQSKGQIFDAMQKFFDKNNLKNVLMVYVSKNSELRNMPEEEMNRAGWVRGNQELLEAYRMKRKYDGLNGRGWYAAKCLEAEIIIRKLEGEIGPWPRL